jgi:hypothetical protein
MGAAARLFPAGLTPKYYPPFIPDFLLAKNKKTGMAL